MFELDSQFESKGKIFKSHYVEDNPDNNRPNNVRIDGAHAICFCGDKIVMVYHEKDGNWTPPGGGVEKGESFEQAAIREVHEESNMKVLHHEFIGYQDVTDGSGSVWRQSRSFCIVEPYGEFIKDPDEDITKIKLIEPKDYKQYFDWLKIGDRIMERATEMKQKINLGKSK